MAIESVKKMVAAAKEQIDNISPTEAARRAKGRRCVDRRYPRRARNAAGRSNTGCDARASWNAGILGVARLPVYERDIQRRQRVRSLLRRWNAVSALRKTLKDMGMERISHIETGFGGWREDDMPIETYEDWQANRKR